MISWYSLSCFVLIQRVLLCEMKLIKYLGKFSNLVINVLFYKIALMVLEWGAYFFYEILYFVNFISFSINWLKIRVELVLVQTIFIKLNKNSLVM